MTSPHAKAPDGRKGNDIARPGYGGTRNTAGSHSRKKQPARVDYGTLTVVVVKTPSVRIRVGFAGRRIGGLEKKAQNLFLITAKTLPAFPFQSIAAFLSRAGSPRLELPRRARLGVRFFPDRTASGSRIPSLLVKPAKQPSGGFSKCFRSFAGALFHARNKSMELRAWRAEKQSIRCVK